jgi:predicted lipoprotein
MTLKLTRAIIVLAAGIGLLWMFPLFHVVPLGKIESAQAAARFDAAEFATNFWDERLIPALDQAADARELLDAIDADVRAAREKFGRSVGISESFLVVLQGTGRVVAVNAKGVELAIRDRTDAADVVLPVGMIFGNTVRDATGRLTVSDFPNSQDFNAVSTELNRLVETRVVSQLRERAEVGETIRFVGCTEIVPDTGRRQPLKVVPLRVEIVPRDSK